MAHGIALIVILISGFGMQATLHLGFPVWLILKIVIWLIFGGFIVLAKKSIISGFIAWFCIIALGLSAFYLAKTHPEIGVKAKVTKTK